MNGNQNKNTWVDVFSWIGRGSHMSVEFVDKFYLALAILTLLFFYFSAIYAT